MDGMTVVRILAAVGLGLLFLAGVFYLAAILNIQLGQLPGDLVIKRDRLTCVVPVITSLVLSLILTLLVNILLRILRR
jgi:hypothetical protein